MGFQFPPKHVEYIREFLTLPDERIDGFLLALDQASPHFNFYDLSAQIFSPENLPWKLTQGIILVLVSLYRTADKGEKTIERFLDEDVFPSLRTAKVFSAEDGGDDWKKLRRFFLSGLSHEPTIGTAAKAGPVQTDHDRIFCEARVLTDLRPIYHFDISERPSAAVVIHMLKITHRDHYGKKYDSFFALDSNDLTTMKQVIERASKKEETLRDVMKDTGVTVLDARLFY
jgi:hypothetical protein